MKDGGSKLYRWSLTWLEDCWLLKKGNLHHHGVFGCHMIFAMEYHIFEHRFQAMYHGGLEMMVKTAFVKQQLLVHALMNWDLVTKLICFMSLEPLNDTAWHCSMKFVWAWIDTAVCTVAAQLKCPWVLSSKLLQIRSYMSLGNLQIWELGLIYGTCTLGLFHQHWCIKMTVEKIWNFQMFGFSQ